MRKGWGDIIDASFVDVTDKVSDIENISTLKIVSKCYSAPFVLNWPNSKKQGVFGQPHKMFWESNLGLLLCLEMDRIRAERTFSVLDWNMWTCLCLPSSSFAHT